MKNPYSELPSPEKCGCLKLEESTYSFDWECPKIQSQVKDTIDFLTKGCSCKKGCHSNHCHCRKKGNYCGRGCQCHSCINMSTTNIAKQTLETSSEEESEEECERQSGRQEQMNLESEDESGNEQEEIITEIVTGFDETFSI